MIEILPTSTWFRFNSTRTVDDDDDTDAINAKILACSDEALSAGYTTLAVLLEYIAESDRDFADCLESLESIKRSGDCGPDPVEGSILHKAIEILRAAVDASKYATKMCNLIRTIEITADFKGIYVAQP